MGKYYFGVLHQASHIGTGVHGAQPGVKAKQESLPWFRNISREAIDSLEPGGVTGGWAAHKCGHVQHADRHLRQAGPLAGRHRCAGHGRPSGLNLFLSRVRIASVCCVVLAPEQHGCVCHGMT